MLIEGVMLPLLFGVKLIGGEYLVISGYSFLGLLGTPVSVICWTSGLGLTSTISSFRLCRMCGISYGVWIACSPKLNRHCWYVRLLCCACAFSIWLLQWSMLDADSDIRFLSRLVLIISSLTIFGYFCPRLISSSTWLVFNLCLWFTDSLYIGSYEFSPANYRFFIPSKGVCHNISGQVLSLWRNFCRHLVPALICSRAFCVFDSCANPVVKHLCSCWDSCWDRFLCLDSIVVSWLFLMASLVLLWSRG